LNVLLGIFDRSGAIRADQEVFFEGPGVIAGQLAHDVPLGYFLLV
jgi:hypothetical protein